MIKVVDIFAGPGGLSEGFAAVTGHNGESIFDVSLSIEKDGNAHETLRLRTFFRLFQKHLPEDYYRLLRNEITLSQLYEKHPYESRTAANRCWNTTLGPGGEPAENIHDRIREVIGNQTSWVLIGGPPCQAYSIAGRSRNKGKPDYDPARDSRQHLYVEYLQILAGHRPAVFIMENVKGLLSAKLENESIFHRILNDLQNPARALLREGRRNKYHQPGGYRIYSLSERSLLEDATVSGSIIRAEEFGIPQARHRVILLGIRDDIIGVNPGLLKRRNPVPMSHVIDDLPRLRSGISPQHADSPEEWIYSLREQANRRWANAGTRKADSEELHKLILRELKSVTLPEADRGAEFVQSDSSASYEKEWFNDNRIGGVCNHSSRSHMLSDLCRYFYAACYAKLYERSPVLKNFPVDLLPDHGNVAEAINNGNHFSDRFRVQVASKPSTTIVSHISKDGHYYIHPDPRQCRSLTVREAARIQTFPDNYLFLGNRTAQYTQAGNAVPPLLARQIGEIVRDILKSAGAND